MRSGTKREARSSATAQPGSGVTHEHVTGAQVASPGPGGARSGSAVSVDPGLSSQLAPGSTLLEVAAASADCTRCGLAEGRTQVVFGVGRADADLMFVGEGPGQQEDLHGIPFVGRAGQLLTQLIEGIGMTRDAVYIANVVRCRPPGNRAPLPDEIAACSPWLARQLELIA